MADYVFHPLTSDFPSLHTDDLEGYQALIDDIREWGSITQPILIDSKGRIVDGRSRYMAWRELVDEGINVELPIRRMDAKDVTTTLIYQLNRHRLHMTKNMRAQLHIATQRQREEELRLWRSQQAQTAERGQTGKFEKPHSEPNTPEVAKMAETPKSGQKQGFASADTRFKPKTKDLSAKKSGAKKELSERDKSRANRVARTGATPLKRLLKAGDISLAKADEVARLSQPDQEEFVKTGKLPADFAPKRDCVGRELPPEIAEVFGASRKIDDLVKQLKRVRSQAQTLMNEPVGYWAKRSEKAIVAAFKTLQNQLEATRPYALCPACLGDGARCKECAHAGWIRKDIWHIRQKTQ